MPSLVNNRDSLIWVAVKKFQSIGTLKRKMTQSIHLTTGVYDMIKDHIRRKKTSPKEEEILKEQLKNATQLTRKNLPLDVVTLDAKVTVKYLDKEQEETYTFVMPHKAKRRNNTLSILSTMGLALVGCKVGDVIHWTLDQEEKQLQIINVERLS
jgi:regulator of nucleoside diphosphate kinase